MILSESATAHRLLDGLSGVELGGSAHNPFRIAGCRNIDYSSNMATIFKKEEEKQAGFALPVDVVAAADLLPFEGDSLDYVLHSHVIEHLWDPIAAIKEWLRVLRPGGIVFMIVPHKERTFDIDRPRTTLKELIDRHIGRSTISPDADPHGHHSVWVTADVVELINYLGLEILEVQDIDDKVGNGFTVVFRKPGELAAHSPLLDLGCGRKKLGGAVGIDHQPVPGVDVVCDVARESLPFAPDSARAVYSNGLFHLLDDPIALLREVIRVAKADASVEIFTPHGSNETSMALGSRQRYSESTWLEILASDALASGDGTLVLREIRLMVPSAIVSELKTRNLPLDFAIRHLPNIVSRIGAIMTVSKPTTSQPLQYVRHVVEERG